MITMMNRPDPKNLTDTAHTMAELLAAVDTDFRHMVLDQMANKLAELQQGYTAKCIRHAAHEYREGV